MIRRLIIAQWDEDIFIVGEITNMRLDFHTSYPLGYVTGSCDFHVIEHREWKPSDRQKWTEEIKKIPEKIDEDSCRKLSEGKV